MIWFFSGFVIPDSFTTFSYKMSWFATIVARAICLLRTNLHGLWSLVSLTLILTLVIMPVTRLIVVGAVSSSAVKPISSLGCRRFILRSGPSCPVNLLVILLLLLNELTGIVKGDSFVVPKLEGPCSIGIFDCQLLIHPGWNCCAICHLEGHIVKSGEGGGILEVGGEPSYVAFPGFVLSAHEHYFGLCSVFRRGVNILPAECIDKLHL